MFFSLDISQIARGAGNFSAQRRRCRAENIQFDIYVVEGGQAVAGRKIYLTHCVNNARAAHSDKSVPRIMRAVPSEL